MAFLNRESGEMTFADGLRLSPDMPMGEGEAICLPPHAVPGGMLAPVCTFEEGGLRAVTLTPCDREGEPLSASKGRALLCETLCLRDPCPDSRRPVRARGAFGEVILSTDPYTGFATARIAYQDAPEYSS